MSLPYLCGYEVPAPVTSTTNEIALVFTTDRSFTYSGFELVWRVDDPSTTTETSKPHWLNWHFIADEMHYPLRSAPEQGRLLQLQGEIDFPHLLVCLCVCPSVYLRRSNLSRVCKS